MSDLFHGNLCYISQCEYYAMAMCLSKYFGPFFFAGVWQSPDPVAKQEVTPFFQDDLCRCHDLMPAETVR
jgi:hypothetical protein